MPPKRERNFLEAFLVNAEAGFDAFTDNEAIRSIPVIGTAFKICKGIDDVRSRILGAKIARFVTEPALCSPSVREKIRQRILEDQDEAEQVGETLFLVLERLTDMNKPRVLAKAYAAYLDAQLSASDLKRIARAIDLAFADDLFAFLASDKLRLHDQTSSWMVALEASGLTSSGVGRAPPGHARTSRSVTSLGHTLWTAWHREPAEA